MNYIVYMNRLKHNHMRHMKYIRIYIYIKRSNISIVCQLEHAEDYDSYLGFQDSRCSNRSVTFRNDEGRICHLIRQAQSAGGNS